MVSTPGSDICDAAELIRLWFTTPSAEDVDEVEELFPYYDATTLAAAIGKLRSAHELLPVHDRPNGLYIADAARAALYERLADAAYCRKWIERLEADARFTLEELSIPNSDSWVTTTGRLVDQILISAEQAGVDLYPEETIADEAAAERFKQLGAAVGSPATIESLLVPGTSPKAHQLPELAQSIADVVVSAVSQPLPAVDYSQTDRVPQRRRRRSYRHPSGASATAEEQASGAPGAQLSRIENLLSELTEEERVRLDSLDAKLNRVLAVLREPKLTESVTVAEFAAQQQKAPSTIYRWICNDPTFPAPLKNGEFAVDELNRWLKK